MQTYGDAEFNNGGWYCREARNFITNNLNKSLTINSPERYDYCMFWRFLYENYKSGTTGQKLQILNNKSI